MKGLEIYIQSEIYPFASPKSVCNISTTLRKRVRDIIPSFKVTSRARRFMAARTSLECSLPDWEER